MPILELSVENSRIDDVTCIHLKIFDFYNGRIALFQNKTHG